MTLRHYAAIDAAMMPLPPRHYAIISPPIFSMPFRFAFSILPMPFSPPRRAIIAIHIRLMMLSYCHSFSPFHYWLSILPAFRFSSFYDYASAIFTPPPIRLHDTLITPPIAADCRRITPLSPSHYA
jgi:hypothetical protein